MAASPLSLTSCVVLLSDHMFLSSCQQHPSLHSKLKAAPVAEGLYCLQPPAHSCPEHELESS